MWCSHCAVIFTSACEGWVGLRQAESGRMKIPGKGPEEAEDLVCQGRKGGIVCFRQRPRGDSDMRDGVGRVGEGP